MTNAQLIGRETMLARLVFFHTARFERNGMITKKDDFIDWLKSLSTRKLSKEYDAVFSEPESSYSTCENDKNYSERLHELNVNLKYSSALMG